MNNKLISIIIPVKNGSNYIKEALTAIQKQSMNVEIIVVDDASDDNTIEIAETFGCKIVRHETCKGQVIAKNSGLKVANGEYIMFHDHDDVMQEGTLQKLYELLEKNLEYSVVMAKLKDFISPDCPNVRAEIKQEPYWGLFAGAALIRKSVFSKIGLFPENITTGEIIWLQTELKENNYETYRLDFVSTMRRIHNTNYGKTNRTKEFKDYASVLRARMMKK